MPDFSVTEIVIMSLGAISLLILLFFFVKGKKYYSMFESLEGKPFYLSQLYGLGYAVLETIHYKYKSNGDRKLRQQLEVLYEKKYCEFYLRAVRSEQVTMFLTVFTFSFAFYGFANDITAFLIIFGFSFLFLYYFGTLPGKQIEERSEALLHDFSELVSKLALLLNAGMTLRKAWEQVAEQGNGLIYDEMRLSVDQMNNGVSAVDAIYSFGSRCIIPEIKKFTSTLIQAMTKSGEEVSEMMKQQSAEVWQMKKQLARRAGEKAASKLLFPICVMFIGILIMVVVPIFTNLGL